MSEKEDDEFKEMMEGMKKTKIVKGTDTGDVWECPICHKRYHLIHLSNGKHVLEEIH